MIREIKETEFRDAINSDSEKIKVVDFYATWCNPCNMLSPILEQLDANNENLDIYKIDVDANSRLADELDINSVPSVFFYKGGEIKKLVLGFQPLQSLQSIVDQIKWKRPMI